MSETIVAPNPGSQRAVVSLADFVPARTLLACTVDPDTFFEEENLVSLRIAKAICATCPIEAGCLAYALNTKQDHGVWGGLATDERRKLRRWQQERRIRQRCCPRCGNPTEPRDRYDSDQCRDAARAESRARDNAARRNGGPRARTERPAADLPAARAS